jgi:TonB family protein
MSRRAYPDDARRARIGGKVILDLSVGADGTVTGVRLLRGVPRLNDVAIDAVKQ